MKRYLPGNPDWKVQAKFILLACFLFFLPFFQKVSVAFIIAFFLLWLFSGDVKVSSRELRKDKNIFLIMLFYLVHVAGLLYTSNFSFAFFDLQTKVSFLLFPLLFPALLISNEQFNKLKWAFISGCFVAVVLCLSVAFKNYFGNASFDYFYYTYYSHFLHPTYFSMYLNLAILFLLEDLIRKWHVYSWWEKTGNVFLCYLFFASIILLSARTANVVAYFSILVFLFSRFKKDAARMWKYFFSFLLVVSFFLIQHFWLNHTNRFNDLETTAAYEEITMPDSIKAPQEEGSNIHLRVKIWESSLSLIKKNPILGVGTGDVKDELADEYARTDFSHGFRQHLNSHNQFLNTTVSLGLIGLLSLLLIFFIGFRAAIRSKDWVYFSFLLIILLNSMTESMFEIQNGILFFAAFNMLFYLRNKLTNQTLPPEAGDANSERLTPNIE